MRSAFNSSSRGTVRQMREEGYSVEVPEGYDEAILRARLALKAEGFSIITEMHVGGMLGPEAGTQRQYLIMGAWSPPAGRREVGQDLQVAVHLPCNVIVQESGASALVAALDPVDDVDESNAVAVETAATARAALGRFMRRVSTPL